MQKLQFRKATTFEATAIWAILQQAILRRKADGSNQWQDGYPNLDVVYKDIEKGRGYVLAENKTILGYCAIACNDEPEYVNLKGEWLSDSDFVVLHRLAISETHLGKGYAQTIFSYVELFAIENKIYSIKADTNFDNYVMLFLFDKLGFSYCGEVFFRGSPRKAFEKKLLFRFSN